MNSMPQVPQQPLVDFLAEEEGVTAIEYALLATLIAGAIVAGVTLLGDSIFSFYQAWTAAVINAI
jgi:pilus assembly protein Flp/PilA